MDCIFCKIVSKEIPAEILFENEEVIAFPDIAPKAPVHIIIIPKKHLASMNELGSDDASMIGQIALAAKKIAAEKGIDQSGYRLLTNCGPDAGQSVAHLHFHLLGGRRLGEIG